MSAYKVFKNYLHNDLQIDKDNIRTLVEEAVESIVERKLEILFRDQYTDKIGMERIIDQTIKDKSADWWWESEDSLDAHIKKSVVRELLKGVKLNVSLVHSQKDATPTGNIVLKRRVAKS